MLAAKMNNRRSCPSTFSLLVVCCAIMIVAGASGCGEKAGSTTPASSSATQTPVAAASSKADLIKIYEYEKAQHDELDAKAQATWKTKSELINEKVPFILQLKEANRISDAEDQQKKFDDESESLSKKYADLLKRKNEQQKKMDAAKKAVDAAP
jgi:hypothetical protein